MMNMSFSVRVYRLPGIIPPRKRVGRKRKWNINFGCAATTLDLLHQASCDNACPYTCNLCKLVPVSHVLLSSLTRHRKTIPIFSLGLFFLMRHYRKGIAYLPPYFLYRHQPLYPNIQRPYHTLNTERHHSISHTGLYLLWYRPYWS